MQTLIDFTDYLDFEKLVSDILLMNGFNVVEVNKLKGIGYDFEIQLENKFGIVEVKLQRNKTARLDLVKRACQQLLFAEKVKKGFVPILIISSYVKESFKKEVKENFGILIWDIKELFGLANNYSDLYYRLEDFLYKAFREPVGELSVIDQYEASKIKPTFIEYRTPTTKKPNLIELNGDKLCKELNEIKAGKRQFSTFEKKCEEILKYLFSNDLELWKTQNETIDKLHKFDLLCRIRPSGKNFWEEILNDFNSRYIVFEFKNYTDKIKQDQIYTTEKYLFKTALRSIAFIIAKNDADKNAYKAASGALKEAGKLIIILSSNDICQMLSLKDNGNEPTELLRSKIDNLLIEMSR